MATFLEEKDVQSHGGALVCRGWVAWICSGKDSSISQPGMQLCAQSQPIIKQ